VKLVVVVGGEVEGGVLAEAGRGAAEIDGNVEDFTADDAEQFCLGIFDLVMEAPENAPGGAGMVVLDEVRRDAGEPRERAQVEGFHEKTAGITEDFRRDEKD